MMKNLSTDEIRKYLQDKEVQQRVRKNMLDARAKATVTISRAASLFGFSESQLREWEKKGYFQTDRTAITSEGRGHRQYSPEDLDKLALMRELRDRGYNISDIPANIDVIWKQVAGEGYVPLTVISNQDGNKIVEGDSRPIDVRVENADNEYFWRFFVSQALRQMLLLICEEIPGTIAGIILPLERKNVRINSPHDIAQAGPSLVGWTGANQAFYTSYHVNPKFEFPSDFRIEPLYYWNEASFPTPIVVIQRRERATNVTEIQVAAMQRLLGLVYTHVDEWLPCFSSGIRDFVDHVTNFNLNPNVIDTVLDKLMDIVVELGGEVSGQARWKFCNLFLPQDSDLPFQQRTLAVRSHSKDSPARLNSMVVSLQQPGLTYRAFQSGQVFYRPSVNAKDPILAYGDVEESTQSAIAIPLGSVDGLAAGAIYIASDEPEAFSVADQRALRFMTRILEELLATFQVRLTIGQKLSQAMARPRVIDAAFRNFYSEEDFIDELEALFIDIQNQNDKAQLEGKEVSFIVLDIDNQSLLANRYGDRVARNLSREVGLRLQGQLRVQSDPDYRKVFHVGADRYFLKLVGMPLDEARKLAVQLLSLLRGDYNVDARRSGKPVSRDEKLFIENVTVRMGVQNYIYLKLKEVLGRRPDIGVAYARTLLLDNFDQSLNVGQEEGGNCVISWNHEKWGYVFWTRGESSS